jgi:phospholipid/cholesterol/gamma-HCH transport system substrate-binding protein
MDENLLRLRVGLLVVMAIIILVILILLNSEGWVSQYDVILKTGSAPGVTRGTPVRKNGILIGRVKDVTTEDDHVRLVLGVNEKESIYINEVASIGAESFLGDAGIEILPLPRDQRGARVAFGDAISRVTVKRNPMEVVDMALDLEAEMFKTLQTVQDAGEYVSSAGAGIDRLAKTVNLALTSEDSDLKLLLTDLNRIFENLNNIVGDPMLKDKTNEAFENLSAVFREVRTTVADTRKTINSFGGVSKRANENLDNLSVLTGSLKENGPEILTQVNSSLKNVDKLLSQAKGFSGALERLEKAFSNKDGTIGKLLNDTAIYDSVRETVDNARDVSVQVKELSVKLEPMARDLRTFADGIARDPGSLGIRGALDLRPSKSGYKGSKRGNGLFR